MRPWSSIPDGLCSVAEQALIDFLDWDDHAQSSGCYSDCLPGARARTQYAGVDLQGPDERTPFVSHFNFHVSPKNVVRCLRSS